MAAEPVTRRFRGQLYVACIGLLFAGLTPALAAEASGQLPKGPLKPTLSGVVERYCNDCHDKETHKGNLDLESATANDVTANPQIWEKVVRRIRARQMPPADKKRPDERHVSHGARGTREFVGRGVGTTSQPGAHRHIPAIEPHGISERHP